MTANTNNPFGFRWTGLAGDGVTPSSGLIQMKINSATTAVFGEGDPLARVTTSAGGTTAGYVTAFTKGVVASYFVGIFKSCRYLNTTLGREVWSNYYPGASQATGDVIVNVEPVTAAAQPKFLVQSSGATAVTLANIGENVDIKSGTSTSGTITGGFYRSACTIDTVSGFGSTTTLPFQIIGLYSDVAAPGAPGSDTASQFNWVIVQANVTQFAGY